MKMNMKYLMLLAVSLMVMSCGKDPEPDPGTELPDWNKTRTTTVLVLGRMNNAPLMQQASSDLEAVSGLVRSTVHSVALLSRADVMPGGLFTWNPVVAVGASAKRVPLFALHSYKDEVAEGNGMLIGHTYARSEMIPVAGGTSFLKVDTRANASIPMIFGTVSIDQQSQVTTASQLVKTHLTDGTIVAGMVSKALAEQWKGEFAQSQYRFELVESTAANASQSIYVVSKSKWVLRAANETTVGSSGISVFNLQIESLQ